MIISHKFAVATGLLAVLFLAPRAGAQISGTISDPGGRPIPQVNVELWSLDARVAAMLTDARGRFSFSPADTRGAVSIVARRIGYAGMSAPIQYGERAAGYIMRPIAASLPRVVVTADRRSCPRHDDPAARALWERARQRYSMLPEGYGMSYDAVADSEDLLSPDATLPPDSVMAGDGFSIGAALRFADTARIHTLGYAWPYYIRTRRHGVERRWRYPHLESYLAEHFASDEFGGRHVFSLADTSAGEFRIAYCAPHGDEPEIAGSIRLRADTSFIDARWRFITPKPHEDAGGIVTFIPYRAAATPPLLLAAWSVSWHRLYVRGGYFAQHSMAFRHWWTQRTMLPVDTYRARVDTVP